MTPILPSSATPPYKSVAIALLFCTILGPIGLLYASFWGGITMLLAGFVVLSSKLAASITAWWVMCCVWGVGAVESHNRKIFSTLTQK